MNNSPSTILPIVGMAIPIILVPIILGLKHARLERQLEHAERMKALELGRTLPRDEAWWSPSRIGASFGVVVPIVVFFLAWLASNQHAASALVIWGSATVVGLAGVVSGAILSYRQAELTAQGSRINDDRFSKPEIDADAFDVVGSRG